MAASSAQLDESFSDLIDFLSPGLATAAPGAAAPGVPAFLWIVPLMASLAASAGLTSPGFFATSTFFGAFIMVRMAAASSSAALRRLARSAARCFSSFSIVPALTTRNAGLAGSATAGLASSTFASTTGSPLGAFAGLTGAAAAAAAASAASRSATSRARASAASRSARSCASRTRCCSFSSSSCTRRRSASACASSSRRASSASRVSAASASSAALVGASSRLTKVRFLRTSTWIVRALPLESACLISLVDLRVSVIFLRSALGTVPCEVRR